VCAALGLATGKIDTISLILHRLFLGLAQIGLTTTLAERLHATWKKIGLPLVFCHFSGYWQPELERGRYADRNITERNITMVIAKLTSPMMKSAILDAKNVGTHIRKFHTQPTILSDALGLDLGLELFIST